MDALYLFRHSVNDDFEIRHSLRSIEMHAPCIRKVWVFAKTSEFRQIRLRRFSVHVRLSTTRKSHPAILIKFKRKPFPGLGVEL
jgi:hypothetical protein